MNLTRSLRYCCRPLLLTAVLMLFGGSSALGQSLTSLRFSFDDDRYIEAKAFLSDSVKIQTTCTARQAVGKLSAPTFQIRDCEIR